MTKRPEPRRLKRTQNAIPAIFFTETNSYQGEILSVSKRGLFVRCMDIPPKDAVVRVVFRHADPPRKLELKGQVIWTTDELPRGKYRDPGFAMQFEDWNAEYHEFFERLLFS